MKAKILYALAFAMSFPFIVGFVDLWVWILTNSQLSPVDWDIGSGLKPGLATTGFVLSWPVLANASMD